MYSQEIFNLIAAHPLFNLLTPTEIQTLVQHIEIKSFAPGEIITEEGAVVDSAYLIKEGRVQITKKITTIEKIENINLVILGKGDAIGLSESDFFSQTGTRTATAVALVPTDLLVIHLKELKKFFHQHGQFYPALKKKTEQYLLMAFIKSTRLFNHLPLETIYRVVHCTKKITLKAGEILFHENDPANQCYFLLSGKISIQSFRNQKEYILCTLEELSLLGEAGFLKGGKRNATAKVITDAELFVLTKKCIEIIDQSKYQKNFFNALKTIRLEQIRPHAKAGVSLKEEKTLENDSLWILTDLTGKHQLSLTQIDYVIWKAIERHLPLIDMLKQNAKTLPTLTLNDLYFRLTNMQKAGLIDIPLDNFANPIPVNRWTQVKAAFKAFFKKMV